MKTVQDFMVTSTLLCMSMMGRMNNNIPKRKFVGFSTFFFQKEEYRFLQFSVMKSHIQMCTHLIGALPGQKKERDRENAIAIMNNHSCKMTHLLTVEEEEEEEAAAERVSLFQRIPKFLGIQTTRTKHL